MASNYSDELREIQRKSKNVFSRKGIRPFLDQGFDDDYDNDYLPGFQIFRLWPEIRVIDDEDIKED